LDVKEDKLMEELEQHWELLAEPIQMMMRKHGIEGAYEQLKEITRGAVVKEEDMLGLVETLDMEETGKSTIDL
jgi:adenylosuccinate lyase